MAGRTRKKLAPVKVSRPGVKAAIIRAVAILYDRHCDEIEQVQEESTQNQISVAFGTLIDCSEAEPIVKTKIKFSAVVTDSVTARLEGVDQEAFEFLDDMDKKDVPEGDPEDDDDSADNVTEPKKPKRSHKKKKAKDEVTVPIEEPAAA